MSTFHWPSPRELEARPIDAEYDVVDEEKEWRAPEIKVFPKPTHYQTRPHSSINHIARLSFSTRPQNLPTLNPWAPNSLLSPLILVMSWARDARCSKPYGPDPAGREIRLFTIDTSGFATESIVACQTSRAWIGTKSLPRWIRPGPHVISADVEAAISSKTPILGAYMEGLPHVQYTAISYAHKADMQEADTMYLFVDGRTTIVPVTLYLALRSLRRIVAGAADPGTHFSPSQSSCDAACLSG